MPRPGAPATLRRRPKRPFFDFGWLAFMSGHDGDLVGFDLALQFGRWGSADQTLAKMLGHGPRLRGAQSRFAAIRWLERFSPIR